MVEEIQQKVYAKRNEYFKIVVKRKEGKRDPRDGITSAIWDIDSHYSSKPIDYERVFAKAFGHLDFNLANSHNYC